MKTVLLPAPALLLKAMFPNPLAVLLVTNVCVVPELFTTPAPLKVSLKLGLSVTGVAAIV